MIGKIKYFPVMILKAKLLAMWYMFGLCNWYMVSWLRHILFTIFRSPPCLCYSWFSFYDHQNKLSVVLVIQIGELVLQFIGHMTLFWLFPYPCQCTLNSRLSTSFVVLKNWIMVKSTILILFVFHWDVHVLKIFDMDLFFTKCCSQKMNSGMKSNA